MATYYGPVATGYLVSDEDMTFTLASASVHGPICCHYPRATNQAMDQGGSTSFIQTEKKHVRFSSPSCPCQQETERRNHQGKKVVSSMIARHKSVLGTESPQCYKGDPARFPLFASLLGPLTGY
jgi:hypothetical protein